MINEIILSSIEEARILGLFKDLSNYYSDNLLKRRLRNILENASSESVALSEIVKRRYNTNITDAQLNRLKELINAFIKKSKYRKNVNYDLKYSLLKKQNSKCAICGCNIDIRSHTDHIVPFKYVGDELPDNFQLLCSKCNIKKKDNLDYQIRFLLKLI